MSSVSGNLIVLIIIKLIDVLMMYTVVHSLIMPKIDLQEFSRKRIMQIIITSLLFAIGVGSFSYFNNVHFKNLIIFHATILILIMYTTKNKIVNAVILFGITFLFVSTAQLPSFLLFRVLLFDLSEPVSILAMQILTFLIVIVCLLKIKQFHAFYAVIQKKLFLKIIVFSLLVSGLGLMYFLNAEENSIVENALTAITFFTILFYGVVTTVIVPQETAEQPDVQTISQPEPVVNHVKRLENLLNRKLSEANKDNPLVLNLNYKAHEKIFFYQLMYMLDILFDNALEHGDEGPIVVSLVVLTKNFILTVSNPYHGEDPLSDIQRHMLQGSVSDKDGLYELKQLVKKFQSVEFDAQIRTYFQYEQKYNSHYVTVSIDISAEDSEEN
ncbi:MAG: hypothetical protein FWE07_06900 [Turicibacter sp.]|nr:hypothetical protein [Turicibacter sp.]